MKISCIQMNMDFAQLDSNYKKAEKLIADAMTNNPDVIVLPETWTTGFFPKDNLSELCDDDGKRVKRELGTLARENEVNIVAGSVPNIKNGKIYNTAFVFSRSGECIAEYDKTHLFTPMNEHCWFEKGSRRTTFELDGFKCGIIICYDVRFPELTRSMAVDGLDYLFVVSQWPDVRIPHLQVLTRARAIENQMFVVCCNSCGTAGDTVYGGHSAVISPWGDVLASAGADEEIITAECDESILAEIRNSINIFSDRRGELYKI